MTQKSATTDYRARLDEMRQTARPYREGWIEVRDYVDPELSRYLESDSQKKRTRAERFSHIINTSPRRAMAIVCAGLQAGMTSEQRRWYKSTIPDRDLAKYAPVAKWFEDVDDTIDKFMKQTNLYGATLANYEEMVGFGTGASLVEEDYKQPVRCRPLTTGEYFLALDSQFRPNVMYRRFAMTAAQLCEEFGKERVSQSVRTAYENNKRQELYMVVHVMEPRDERNVRRQDALNMPYKSVYFEESGDHSTVLRESGYRRQPFAVCRWATHGSDIYGTSPMQYAMGDIKQLQAMERSKLKGIQKHVDPTWIAPTHWRGKVLPTIPGAVIHDDTPRGQEGVRPATQIKPDTGPLSLEIQEKVRQIYEAVYADLFIAISSQASQKGQKTAYEIAQIYREQLLLLGSTVGKIQAEYLQHLYYGYYDVLWNWGLLPPPPPELWGMEHKVEFVGMLVQAQRAVDTQAIEQTLAFAANTMAVDPTAADALDSQEAVVTYGELLGVPAKILNSKETRDQIAAERQRQQAEQEALMRTAAGADALKKMSETKLGEEDNLLATAIGA